jgi:hypothetical protein
VSDQKVEQGDLRSAYNKVDFPHGYETQGDVDKVQWAARRAVAALERLSIECSIAKARRDAGIDSRNAKRSRELISTLVKLRSVNREQVAE